VRGSERYAKQHVQLVNLSFIVLNNKIKSLEFLFASLPLTPHQIGIGQEVILISSTPHASKIFTTPIGTFEDTLD
jgi:hypothetical protein